MVVIAHPSRGEAQLHAFRRSGPDSEQQAAILDADVREFDASERAYR